MRAIDVHAAIVGTEADAAPQEAQGAVAQLHWASEDETRRFAERLARQPAIGNAFIALHGELGAGKTTLVRHLLRAMGVAGRVKSPTYAVLEPHEALGPDGRSVAVSHFDFYRFSDPREFDDAGFRDLFAAPGLKLAEWPQKAGAALPLADLQIHIEVMPDGSRDARVHCATALGRALLEQACRP